MALAVFCKQVEGVVVRKVFKLCMQSKDARISGSQSLRFSSENGTRN
jgi:hypothetical protein